jgi:hypothetical protein
MTERSSTALGGTEPAPPSMSHHHADPMLVQREGVFAKYESPRRRLSKALIDPNLGPNYRTL